MVFQASLGKLLLRNSHAVPPLRMPYGFKELEWCAPYMYGNWKQQPNCRRGNVVAQLAARQGVPVVSDEYELMPHNRPTVVPNHPHSIKCYHPWADTCSPFVQGAPVTAK